MAAVCMCGAPGTVTRPSDQGGPELRSSAAGPFRCYLEAEAHPAAVPAIRHAARPTLAHWRLGPIAAHAELVLTELLSNAIRATQAAAPPGPGRIHHIASRLAIAPRRRIPPAAVP